MQIVTNVIDIAITIKTKPIISRHDNKNVIEIGKANTNKSDNNNNTINNSYVLLWNGKPI